RFGDPETQAVLPRLKTDLADIIEAVIDERLSQVTIEWDKKSSVCVVMASGGYPGKYGKGFIVEGLDAAAAMKDVVVFHAGTSSAGCGTVTSGGRVLGVTGLGGSVKDAVDNAYAAVAKIKFEDMYFRRDIGAKALKCR
ncbi:MAG: phosphoribosylglycinamide synthetase C domain-containing protein, partial [Candidatus Margulisiibacteriota bacterium]